MFDDFSQPLTDQIFPCNLSEVGNGSWVYIKKYHFKWGQTII